VAEIRHTVGILGAMLGTLAAILLLPDDYYEPGQLRVSALLLSLGLLSGPVLSSSTDIRAWLRAESVLMVGLIYWLLMEPLGSGYTAYELTRAGVIKGFSLIGLFAVMILIGSKLANTWHNSFSRVSSPTQDFSASWLYNALLVCSALGFLSRLIPCGFSPSCLVDGLLSERGVGAWNRGVIGGSGAFALHLAYFGYLTLPLTVAFHHRIGRIDFRVVIGFLLSILFLLFLMKDGGRRLAGMVLGSGLLTWLLLQPRISLKQILIGFAMGVAILALMELMFIFRTETGGVISNFFNGRALGFNPLRSGLRVDNNFEFFVKTLDLIPEFKRFVGWSAILYWLVRPIPRVFWPDKPIGPGISLPFELNQYWSDNFTLTISAIGDWYISYGVVSVTVAALITGFLAGKLGLVWLGPTVRQKLLYSLGLMCLFISLRNYLELILMSYPLLALYFLGKLSQKPTSPTMSTVSMRSPK